MAQKDAAKSGAEEKKAAEVVLKFDTKCENCAKEIKKAVRSSYGVDKVSVDVASYELTATGTGMVPAKIKEIVEEKNGKNVEIVSSLLKKGGGGGGTDKDKTDTKSEKKSGDRKAKDKKLKELALSTVVLKTPLHCDDWRLDISNTIWHIKGVESVLMDKEKNLVTVKGTMDAKSLLSCLNEMIEESVEEGGGDKKGKK